MKNPFRFLWTLWVLSGALLLWTLFVTPPPLPFFPVEFLIVLCLGGWGGVGLITARIHLEYRRQVDEGPVEAPEKLLKRPAGKRWGDRPVTTVTKPDAALMFRGHSLVVDNFRELEAWQVLPAAIRKCPGGTEFTNVEGLHHWQIDPRNPQAYLRHEHPFKPNYVVIYCDWCHKAMIQEHISSVPASLGVEPLEAPLFEDEEQEDRLEHPDTETNS